MAKTYSDADFAQLEWNMLELNRIMHKFRYGDKNGDPKYSNPTNTQVWAAEKAAADYYANVFSPAEQARRAAKNV